MEPLRRSERQSLAQLPFFATALLRTRKAACQGKSLGRWVPVSRRGLDAGTMVAPLSYSSSARKTQRSCLMATVHHTTTEQPHSPERLAPGQQVPELRLYSHSTLFYWWPVWLLGYLFALLTYLQGEQVTI